MEGLRRNVFTSGEKKVSYTSLLGELKKHKQNMCLQFLFCSCTIALEQDVLQDCFSLSFALYSGDQTSAKPHSSMKQPTFPFSNSLWAVLQCTLV